MSSPLEGKTIAISGATGFLGTALIEAIVSSTKSAKVLALIRSGKRLSPQERLIKEILKNDAFDPLRNRYKEEFDKNVSERIVAIEADVSKDGLLLSDNSKELLKQASVFIHSAATVEFDSPYDIATEINLLGPYRFAKAIIDIHGPNLKDLHFIDVSTAYVSSFKKGLTKEELLTNYTNDLGINWKTESETAKAIRANIELKSRDLKTLKTFQQQAESELGGSGRKLVAKKTEDLRKNWVDSEMIKIGRARAQALGWPDVYAFTKSLGEIAVEELNIPTTIVRPSIIECALRSPFPGWIKGFRMADPIIISYAKGLLKEFPGIPEGIIDLIPVDLVVNLILAVAAYGYDPSREVYHICSGSRNPLKYREMVEQTKSYFALNPLYDSKGQPIPLPNWSYPGRHQVQRELKRTLALLDNISAVANRLPLRGKITEFVLDVDEKRQLIKRAQNYAELYGSYTETEAIFDLKNALELKDQFNEISFDPIEINWTDYLHNIYLPSVVKHARVPTKPKKLSFDKSKRHMQAIFSKEQQLAIFDLENTLMASNVVIAYAWLASYKLDWQQKFALATKLLLKAPFLISLDKRDRSDFLRYFYRHYKDASINEISATSEELLSKYLINKLFPQAIAAIRRHRTLGHKTVLITGAIKEIVDPLKPLFDDIISVELSKIDNRFSGEIVGSVPTGEVRAWLLQNYCEKNSLDLSRTVAYADSITDLALLDMVGYPVVINPDLKLAAIAKKRGWPTYYWSTSKGPLKLIPLAKNQENSEPSELVKTSAKILEAIRYRLH